jgi:putative copper export protein
LWPGGITAIIGPVSELRVPAAAWRATPTAIGVVSGTAVAGVILASLLRATFGRYGVEAVALVSAAATAGMTVFAAIASRDLPVVDWLRDIVTRVAIVALASALLTLPFAVMTVSGDGLRGLGDGLARSVVLHSGDFQTVVVRTVGLLVVFAAFRTTNERWIRVVGPIGALVVAGSFLFTGHVRSHGPTLAVVVTALAHVIAATAWFGGLIALGVCLRRCRDEPVASGWLLAGFARIMTGVLSLLVAAGAGLAVLYLPTPSALVRTAYGQVLLVKLALVASVLVLSFANHWRLVPAARRGNARAVRVLRANIAAEQLVLGAVLVITAVLMRQNPGS